MTKAGGPGGRRGIPTQIGFGDWKQQSGEADHGEEPTEVDAAARLLAEGAVLKAPKLPSPESLRPAVDAPPPAAVVAMPPAPDPAAAPPAPAAPPPALAPAPRDLGASPAATRRDDPPDDGEAANRPPIEIELVHERGSASIVDKSWVALEVWTRNRVYMLDGSLKCIEVFDRAKRQAEPQHPMLGARLVGGQAREGASMQVSHPYPRVGSEAVFEHTGGKRLRFSQTSKVLRVVLRLRVLSVAPDYLVPMWEEITDATYRRKR